MAVLRSDGDRGEGESVRPRHAGSSAGTGWRSRRPRGRWRPRRAAGSRRHERKARRWPLQAHHRTWQLRLGDCGIQGLRDDARGRPIRSPRARLRRRNEEAHPEQADSVRDEHASALRSHGRAAGTRCRRRDDHHAEEQREVPGGCAQHSTNVDGRHAGEESEEGEGRGGGGEEGVLRRDANRRDVPHLSGASLEWPDGRVHPEREDSVQGRLLVARSRTTRQRSREGARAGAREAQADGFRSLHQRAYVRSAADEGRTVEGRREVARLFRVTKTAAIAAAVFAVTVFAAEPRPAGALITVDTPMAAPEWARLERSLLDAHTPAIVEFYNKYYDSRGYVQCVLRWGADDGPDDAFENMAGWPELHALGGSDEVLRLTMQGVEGMLKQYTEAKTTQVPAGRNGMYYKEFSTQSDWMHHGEALRVFNRMGLSVPDDPKYRERARRYAALYMGEDAEAPNYDPRLKLIRSLINGSRGPMLRKATALD